MVRRQLTCGKSAPHRNRHSFALGGPAREIVGKLLGRLAALVGVGVALGILGTLWLARFLAPLLYGLTPYEPVVILAAILILAVVAAAAGWIPFSRAARIDPARVLREV